MIAPGEDASDAERVAALAPAARAAEMDRLWRLYGSALCSLWHWWARPSQQPPAGAWRTWLIMAGRGFGKTRAGAEWVRRIAETNGAARIALVAATMAEARAVMVEGESGILAISPDATRPRWEPSLGRLRWPGGAEAHVYSAAEPESLRGPQHHAAWADEIAKWPAGETAWDNLMLGLRCGRMPQAVATTTPRPVPLIRRLVDEAKAGEAGVEITGGSSDANRCHLAAGFLTAVRARYGGTRLGRQELDGMLIEDVEGSLWPRDLIERCRGFPPEVAGGVAAEESRGSGEDGLEAGALPLHQVSPGPPVGRSLKRVVIGVDPPVSVGGDACGIVVCGLGADGLGYVLADATVSGLRPEGWARAVVRAAEIWDADRVIVETNQGGDMVETVLRSVDCRLPVRPARAHKGKSARAEPIASLFERGKAKLAGAFPALEDELAGMTIRGGYEGPGRSPDRADAMVWAMTELLRERPMPRVRFL